MNRSYALLNKLVQIIEYLFAVIVLVAVISSFISSVSHFINVDWNNNKTFYDLIYRILLLVIGLELARLLITHNLQAVVELIAFVIARKTLKPDVTSFDILLIVVSFFLLMLSRLLINNDVSNQIKKILWKK